MAEVDPDSNYGKEITWIGNLSSAFVAIFFVVWSGKLSDHTAIFWSLILGITLQLILWRSLEKLNNYGFSLLVSLAIIVLLSFFPYAKFILIFCFFYLIFTFSKKTFPLFKNKNGFLLSSLFVISIAYGIIIFLCTSRNVGDAFVDEKVRQLTLNPDTLFFSAMSTMFKNYHVIATGLHGLRWEHYHVLAFMLYSRLSSLLDIEPIQVYGYTHYIALAPFICSGYLRLADSFSFKSKHKWLIINLVVLSLGFSEFFGWQSNSNILSESYAIGLLLLSGSLALLSQFIRKNENYFFSFFILALYLPLICLAKISVGLIFFIALFLSIFLKKNIHYIPRLFMLFVATISAALGYYISRTTPIPGFFEAQLKWNYYWEFVIGKNNISLTRLYIQMLPMLPLMLPLFFILWRNKSLSREKFTWFSIFFATIVVGFFGLNMTIDSSGYYFSNLQFYISIPLLILIFSEQEILALQNFSYPKYFNIPSAYMIFILAVCVSSISFYFMKLMPWEISMLRSARGQIISHHRMNENSYSLLLKKIRLDPDKNTMVYIPKKELAYWKNSDDTYAPWSVYHCIAMSFYIPILSGKPAIFGLPIDPIKCDMLFRGFEEYTPAEYEASQVKDYSNEDICKSVIKFGFKSFYRITEIEGSKKIHCKENI